MENTIKVKANKSKSPLYFEGSRLVARMPNNTQRIKPTISVVGFKGKDVLCHVFIKESNRMFFVHEGLDTQMVFDEDHLYAPALLVSGEVVSSHEETKRSGTTLKKVVVRFKGEDFLLTVGSSFIFKTKGRWNPDEAGSSDGLRPEVESGGIQVSESDSVYFPNSGDLNRLKKLL